MRDKILFIALALCGGLTLTPAEGVTATGAQGAAAARVAGVVPCDVLAYANDPDPSGLNVRSGPGNKYGIIGNLPNQGVDGVVVHVNGSKGGWLRINRASEAGGDEVLFSGEGWVYGPLLGVDGVGWLEGGTPLYGGPAKRGRVLTRIPADGPGPTIIRGCRGRWMYVEHRGVKGWAAPGTLCSNPLTTCS